MSNRDQFSRGDVKKQVLSTKQTVGEVEEEGSKSYDIVRMILFRREKQMGKGLGSAFGFSALILVGVIWGPLLAAAASCQSNGTGGGNWSNSASWQNCGGSVPGTLVRDAVQILSGDTIVLDTLDAGSLGVTTLTIDNGGVLTEDGNGRVLNITSAWTNNGTFNAGVSTVSYGTASGATISGNTTFYKLSFAPSGASTYTVDAGATVNVSNELTIGGGNRVTIDTGTIHAKGNITVTNTATGAQGGGTGTISIDGTGDQTLTGGAAADDRRGKLPKISVNKTSGTFYLDDVIALGNDWTYVQGTVDATTNDSEVVVVKDLQVNAAGMTFNDLTVAIHGTTATTLTLADDLVVAGDFVFTSATTTAANYDITVGGNWDNTSGVFTPGTGTVFFNKSTGTQTVTPGGTSSGKTFYNLTHSGAGTLQLAGNLAVTNVLANSTGTLDLNGKNVSATPTINNDATLKLQGDETISATPTNGTGSTVEYTATAGTRDIKDWTYHHLTVNGTGGTFTLPGDKTLGGNLVVSNGTLDLGNNTLNAIGSLSVAATLDAENATLDVDDDVTISGGELIAPDGARFTVGGDWTKTGGVFTPGTGTVAFDKTGGVQTISGSSSFYNLTKTTATSATLTFAAGTTQTIANALTLRGDSGGTLTLRSSVDGTQWAIDPQGGRTISYLDVKDSNNINSTALDCSDNCTDSGNNTGWTFPAPAADEGGAVSSGSGGHAVFWQPPGGFRILINGGAVLTGSRLVRLGLFGGLNTKRVLIASRPDFADGVWYDYRPTLDWDLCRDRDQFCPDGEYRIFAKFYDAISLLNSGVVSAAISYQSVTPPLPQPVLSPHPAVASPPEIQVEEEAVVSPAPSALEQSLALNGRFRLLPDPALGRLVFAPLPKELLGWAEKFPELKRVFADLGMGRLSDTLRLRGGALIIPGFGQLAAGGEWPAETIFVADPSGQIDYRLALRITGEGKVKEETKLLAGQPVRLLVKPEATARRVFGLVVLADQRRSAQEEKTAVWLSAPTVWAAEKLAEEELVLSSFDYRGPDERGFYGAEVTMPAVAGAYEVITVIDYEAVDLGSKELRLITVVDPEGYIYEKVGEQELRVAGALVRLEVYNPITTTFELWPAESFLQQNPQTTDSRGTYAFLVPEGKYRLLVEASGYKSWVGEPFEVKRGGGVHQNVELARSDSLFRITPTGVLLVLLIVSLLYNFYRDRLREKKNHQ